MKFEGIVECTNEEYHGEKKHLSSSNFKLLLKDPGEFYKQKILGERPEIATRTQNAFDEGSYAHSLILEPHMVSQEYAFFNGWRKQGKEWEEFKEQNKHLTILSKPQKVRVEQWVSSYNKLPAAVELIKGGYSEHTLFGELLGVPVKVRADYINIDKGYIADVKTTSGLADVDSFKYTVDSFKYELSAALYCKMFEQHYNKDFDFYFIVLSKRDKSCEVFKLSKETRQFGEAQLLESIKTYKNCLESGVWTKIEKYDSLDVGDYEIQEV